MLVTILMYIHIIATDDPVQNPHTRRSTKAKFERQARDAVKKSAASKRGGRGRGRNTTP